jgi:hypothetical protein
MILTKREFYPQITQMPQIFISNFLICENLRNLRKNLA